MKKYILLIIAILLNVSAFATTVQVSTPGGKMLSGLSIALLVTLGLIFYMSFEKSKLYKEIKRLENKVNELERE